MRTAIEAHRRNRPYCMGSLLWQHNDCWLMASWSTRDYYGKWKAAHYLVKKAFENVIASAEISGDSLKIYAISDLLRPVRGNLSIAIYTLDGKNVWSNDSKVKIPANTSAMIWDSSLHSITDGLDPKDIVINVTIECDGNVHSGNYYLCKQKDLRFRRPDIDLTLQPIDGGYIANLKSDKFVRAIWLSIDDDDTKFDENCFDLLPGISHTCIVRTALSSAEIKSRLKIQCLNDI